MEICIELKKLATEISKTSHTLYIVGGFVRDSLMGNVAYDIDITSSMPCEDVKKICNDLKYKCTEINKNLGTLQISTGGKVFEYTRFRKESYVSHANHTPTDVVFVDDIIEDSKRRDLSINAIYYDISHEKFIDPCGGKKDTENKVIRTANLPHITLRDDGLRILRVIRFSAQLGFRIERKTARALKHFGGNLKKISKERIQKELSQIVVADLKYGNPSTLALDLIQKNKLLKYIFNIRLESVKFTKTEIKNFYSLSSDARLMGFYFLVLKKYLNGVTHSDQLLFASNMLLGRDGLRESNSNISTLNKLYMIYQNLSSSSDHFTASINYLTLSNTEREIIDNNIDIDTKDTLSANIKWIKDKKLPLSVNELPVKGGDLKDAGIEEKYIGKILSVLYNQVLAMETKNTKEDLLNKAKEINDAFLELSKK